MDMRQFWTDLIQDAVDSIPEYKTRIKELEKELVTANSRIRGLTDCIHMKDAALKQIMPDWIPTDVEHEI